jgi:stage V sporulation protein B
LFNAVINYTLTALPAFGIRGAALGTTIGFAIAAFLNLYYVKKESGFIIDFKSLILKPIIAVLLMAGFVKLAYLGVFILLTKLNFIYAYQFTTIAVIVMAGFIYLFILLLLKEIKYNDLAVMPAFGERLASLLLKRGLLEEE